MSATCERPLCFIASVQALCLSLLRILLGMSVVEMALPSPSLTQTRRGVLPCSIVARSMIASDHSSWIRS